VSDRATSHIRKTNRSIQEAARILGTTSCCIRRILAIAKEKGPKALLKTRWGSGCQKEKEEFTDEQKHWSTAPRRLRE